MSGRPRLLDLCTGGMGAAKGYADAGYDVTGIDRHQRRDLPDGVTFIKADVRDVLADVDYLRTFDVVTGSPPCQTHSRTKHLRDAQGKGTSKVDMIPETRSALLAAGVPYVLENVPGAPLRPDLVLCGSMFPELHVYDDTGRRWLQRHRVFESNVPLTAPGPCRHAEAGVRPLDPTWGRGTWWKKWQPARLHTTPAGTDFTDLDIADDTFDAAAYDPPYVCVGGRETSGIKDMYRRYGQLDAPRTPEQVQALIDAGLAEMARVVRPSARRAMSDTDPNGVVLVKCQDYIWSGRYWPGTHHTLQTAERCGLVLEDRFELIAVSPRPQPQRSRADGRPSRQQHARRNLSTLLVLRKIRRRPAGDTP